MMPRRTVVALALAAALLAGALPGRNQSAQASTFNPQFSSPVNFSTTAPGGNPDISIGFDIPPPSAIGGATNFADPDLATAADAQIPNGAYIGRITTIAKLGLANEGCQTDTPVDFDLVEANTDTTALPMTPGVILAAAINNSQNSFTYVSAGDPIGPSDNDVTRMRNEIQIDSEQMVIETINEGTNTYSFVTRGWNGTTPAAHNAGAEIRKLNVIFPAGSSSNVQGNMAEDDGDLDNNGTAEFPQFGNNGLADAVDSMPASVRDSLDPNGNADDGGAVAQHARYFGSSVVAGTLIIPINIVVLAPGALSVFPNQDWMTPAWGTASVIILGDPEAPPSNSGITDFCNLSSNSTIFGVSHDNSCTTGLARPPECASAFGGFNMRGAVDGGCPGVTTPNECGFVRATNPAPKTLTARVYAVSDRDYDNDGHSNSLDVCATVPNPTWNPYAFNALSGQDVDGDGLPDPCDPGPTSFNSDQDGDGWFNRIDNCPGTPNPATGGGPGGDQIQDSGTGMSRAARLLETGALTPTA